MVWKQTIAQARGEAEAGSPHTRVVLVEALWKKNRQTGFGPSQRSSYWDPRYLGSVHFPSSKSKMTGLPHTVGGLNNYQYHGPIFRVEQQYPQKKNTCSYLGLFVILPEKGSPLG